MQNPSTCDCQCNNACKIDEHLDSEKCSCKKCLIGELVLECEDEILNTTETWLDNKNVTWKNNYLIHTISLVNIHLLLLAVVSIGCYYFYAKDWIRREHVVS